MKTHNSIGWSTILKQSKLMPISIRDNKRGIYLGRTRDGKCIKVIKEGIQTPSEYSPDFWEVDEGYMNEREKIANLLGRIAESNEPSDIEEYQKELDYIYRKIRAKS